MCQNLENGVELNRESDGAHDLIVEKTTQDWPKSLTFDLAV